jgi:hypothetical protein
MNARQLHQWYIGAPKRKQSVIESIPRIDASYEAPIIVTLDQFIHSYHVLTDAEKESVLSQFHVKNWKSPIQLTEPHNSFPDTTLVPAPSIDELLQSLLLIMDSFYGKTMRLETTFDIEMRLQGVEMTAQRVASLVELYLLDGKHQRAIDMLQGYNSVSKISRKRLERACKADAVFMLPNLPLFVQKNVTLAKDALSLCMKLQKKNEDVAKQLISHPSIEPWAYLGDALQYKMFTLANAIIYMPVPIDKTYTIEAKQIVKLVKYSQCDPIVQTLCREPCFIPSRYTIAIELYKVARYKESANALIPMNHPRYFEYLKETNQLESIDIRNFVQMANQSSFNVQNIPKDRVREALEHGLDQTKVSLEDLFAYKPDDQIDYAKIVKFYGTETVITHIQTETAWVGFLHAPIVFTKKIAEKLLSKLPIGLFTTNILRECQKYVDSYNWMNSVILRTSLEAPHVIDAFIQQYPNDLGITYSLNDVKYSKEFNFDGMSRMTLGGVLHASMFPNVAEYGLWDISDKSPDAFLRWCIDALGLSLFDVFECANKSQNDSVIYALKKIYPQLENNDLLEHINLEPDSFPETKDSYIVDLWHATKSIEKPTHSLSFRNHYTWFNPSFDEVHIREGNGRLLEMLNTYMPQDDMSDTDTMWVKRIRVNIKPLLWFNHKRASDLDEDRRLILSQVFARYTSNGRMFGFHEIEDTDEIAERTKLYMENNKELEKRLHKFDAHEFDCLRVDQDFICPNVHDILQSSDYDAVISYDITDGEPDTKSIIVFDVPSVLVHEWDWTKI